MRSTYRGSYSCCYMLFTQKQLEQQLKTRLKTLTWRQVSGNQLEIGDHNMPRGKNSSEFQSGQIIALHPLKLPSRAIQTI